jgi:hypothetical protein
MGFRGGIERRTDQIDTFQFSPTLLLVTAQKNFPEPEPMPGALLPAYLFITHIN